MRIKSIPVIAGLLFFAAGASSCLSSEDKVVEVSTDARILGLELEPVNGVNYKFDIDQENGLIFNADSLPVKSDTLMNAIRVKSVAARGLIVYKEDSILHLDKPIQIPMVNGIPQLKITSFAPDGKSKKEYYLKINIHQQDPEGYSWKKIADLGNEKVLKAVFLNNHLVVIYEGGTVVRDGQKGELPEGADVTTLTELSEKLFINDKDHNIFKSEDGLSWSKLEGAAGKLISFIIPKRLVALNNDCLLISKDDGATWENTSSELPAGFPVLNLQSASKGDGRETIVIGEAKDGKLCPAPWFSYNGETWSELQSSSEAKKMPQTKGMHLFVYNHKAVLANDSLNDVRSSQTGMEWVVEKSLKFPEVKMEVASVCTDGDFIYLVGRESEKYSVWRGRLNKLGFKNKK